MEKHVRRIVKKWAHVKKLTRAQVGYNLGSPQFKQVRENPDDVMVKINEKLNIYVVVKNIYTMANKDYDHLKH